MPAGIWPGSCTCGMPIPPPPAGGGAAAPGASERAFRKSSNTALVAGGCSAPPPANGKLPVVNFVAGGIDASDAALVMQLGAEGVFVGSGIFKSEDPARMANAIVQATTHFADPKIIAEVSKGLGAPMRGLAMEAIPDQERLAVRGW